ncbi:MAG TPA: hypothetical protein PKD85_15480, partial [Saprospiraceae bacterium]|nr:hypothetical protein [Saprospiraceae bacterium]
MKKAASANPLFLLDEIDKIGKGEKGDDVQGALIHVTDYSQNHEFKDAYISEFPHDISNFWFFYSMNDDVTIDPVLRDRLHIIDVESYSNNEMKEIIQKYVLLLLISTTLDVPLY